MPEALRVTDAVAAYMELTREPPRIHQMATCCLSGKVGKETARRGVCFIWSGKIYLRKSPWGGAAKPAKTGHAELGRGEFGVERAMCADVLGQEWVQGFKDGEGRTCSGVWILFEP